jgi:hypothetical protein
MPGMDECAVDRFVFFAALFATPFVALFLATTFFFAAALVFAAGLDGIAMPGIFICAVAGAETAINASVLAATISLLFTIPTPIESADATASPP